jgi:ABC-2 type transport system permease protein
MMYSNLVKLFLKENISLKRLFGFDYRKSKVKGVLIGLAIIYALIVFIGAFGYMFFDLGKILKEMGQPHLLLGFLAVYSIGLSLVIVFFRANGSLFFYKDYEILSPLPIHPRTILAAKMTVLLIMLYASSLVFTLPITFSYFYWNGLHPVSLLFYIVLFFFLPLVPVVFMSLLSLGIAILTRRFRRSQLLNIVLMFGIFVALFMVSFSVNEATVNPLTGQIDLFSGLSSGYPPLLWFTNAVSKRNVLDLIYLVFSHAALFFLFLYFIEDVVQKTNQKGQRAHTRINGKPVTYQARHAVFALVQKEIRKFFSIPLYAINAGLGPVILIVLSVASLFYRTEIEGILQDMIGTGLRIELMILVLIAFCTTMTYTPAISLSLEGKNFWIIKSLPLRADRVMLSKIIFNLILIVPISLLSVILFGFSIGIDMTTQVLLILLSTVFATLISVMDAVVNLYMPKFDFVNEVEVIKQSAGALLAIFGGFLMMAISGFLYVFFDRHMAFEAVLALLVLVNLILLVPFLYIIKTKSQGLFDRMKA